jgi:hypothetical protein
LQHQPEDAIARRSSLENAVETTRAIAGAAPLDAYIAVTEPLGRPTGAPGIAERAAEE